MLCPSTFLFVIADIASVLFQSIITEATDCHQSTLDYSNISVSNGLLVSILKNSTNTVHFYLAVVSRPLPAFYFKSCYTKNLRPILSEGATSAIQPGSRISATQNLYET